MPPLPTRPLFVSVVAIIVVGSIMGAFAPTSSMLLIARLLQAVGTGLLTHIGMNITLAVAPWTTLMWVFGGLTLLVLIVGAVVLRNVADLGRPVLGSDRA